MVMKLKQAHASDVNAIGSGASDSAIGIAF
jgi:hypothetical protein